MNNKYDMTIGTPWKKMLFFAIPLFLGNLVQQLYNTVDAIIAGHFIGSSALAAVGANMPFIQIAIALFMGISMGANVLISQNFGAKKYDKLRGILDTFMIFIYIASITFSILGIIFANNLHSMLGTPKDILSDANSYLKIILLGNIAMFGYNGVSAVLRGIGDSKTPLMFLIISSILNIFFDIFFVTVINLGVAGLALATVLAQALSFIFSIIYLNKKHTIISIHFRKSRINKSVLKDIITIGLPSGIQGVLIALGMSVLQLLVNSFGVITMAGYNIASRIEIVAFLAGQNFGITLATYIGQNIGAGDWHRVSIGVRSASIMVTIISTLFVATIFLFNTQILMIFTKDLDVIESARSYLFIVSPFYIIGSYLFTIMMGIRGSGATIVPMIIVSISQVFLRIPLAYFLVNLLKTPYGIWWAVPAPWVLSSILATIYYKSGVWKKHARVTTNIESDII